MPKQKTYQTTIKQTKKAFKLDMNRLNLDKAYIIPNFKTGAHETIKDKPRNKNWRKWEDE